MVYEPREDSFLLIKAIKSLNPKGKIAIDMGTGSGIIAEELSKRFEVVYAVDIDEDAVKLCRKKFKGKNVRVIQSNLFAEMPKDLKEKVDLIVFNPPYLPCSYEEDPQLCCGDGNLITRFLQEAREFLSKEGFILILLSSLTPISIDGEVVERQKLAFEELRIYKIKKS